jgi:tartrate dehydrogenase/decarboxylase/D-malate dehydrogenase
VSQRIVIIPGDGIGRDVVAEVVPILTALGGLELEQLPWSADYYLQTGVTIPPDGYDTLRSFDAVFIGALAVLTQPYRMPRVLYLSSWIVPPAALLLWLYGPQLIVRVFPPESR